MVHKKLRWKFCSKTKFIDYKQMVTFLSRYFGSYGFVLIFWEGDVFDLVFVVCDHRLNVLELAKVYSFDSERTCLIKSKRVPSNERRDVDTKIYSVRLWDDMDFMRFTIYRDLKCGCNLQNCCLSVSSLFVVCIECECSTYGCGVANSWKSRVQKRWLMTNNVTAAFDE